MRKSRRTRKIQKAAKMGKPYALYELGIMYDEGRGVEQNVCLAAELIREAAERGCVRAQEWLSANGFDDDGFDDDALVQAWS